MDIVMGICGGELYNYVKLNNFMMQIKVNK